MQLLLDKCEGLDTRPAWQAEDRFSLDTASNVQIDPGGSISTRPAILKVNDLHAKSVGLYARGGLLRTIVPSGQSYQALAPTGVIYDGIGRGGTYNYDDKISKVLGAESFGVSGIYGPHGYVALLRADTGLVEHHWIKEPPAAVATYVDTMMSALPFLPGKSIIRIANKIVATSPSEGYFRYCSTLTGPTDWTTSGDAGFENALQFVSGAREIIALGIHRGLLAVYYADAVQLWNMDEDPANISLAQVMNGPGTEFPGSVVNILGDGVFLSRSGFSNLTTAGLTGEAIFGDIGDKIKTLTASIVSTDSPLSLWSQKRGQMICVNGTTAYAYGVYPSAQETSWTTWTIPATVTALTENAGIVYLRIGNAYYRLDDTIGTDYDGNAIAWTVQTRPLNLGSMSAKALRHLTVQSTGASTWTPIVDGRVLTACAVTIPAGTTPIRSLFQGDGRRIALRGTGTGLTRIDGIEIEADKGGQ